MGKIYKLNNAGSVGVSLNKQMKAAGYEAGKEAEWEAVANGFVLKLKTNITKPAEPAPATTPV